MCERAFLEVTGDDSDVVIFSLDQTQFVVQHANKRSYKKEKITGEKRNRQVRSLTSNRVFFYYQFLSLPNNDEYSQRQRISL